MTRRRFNSVKSFRTWVRNTSKTAILRAVDKGQRYERLRRLAIAIRRDQEMDTPE